MMTMLATMSNMTKVTVTPMKAAVLRQRLSGTELRLITTSSLSSSASLNWTSEGDTTWKSSRLSLYSTDVTNDS